MTRNIYFSNFIDILVKRSFWDDFKQEMKEIWDIVEDFFLMIKEYTYDVVADLIGADVTNMILIAVGVIGIMLVCLAVINR